MGKLIQSGTAMLVAGALLLSGLLVYALLFVDGGASSNPAGKAGHSGPIAEVAVFFPGPDDWADFRRGIALAASKGLGRVVGEADDVVIVETPRHRRSVRFTWEDAGGVAETRRRLSALLDGPRPPSAVVGSSNTVLTVALAEALAAAAPRDGVEPPVLLVPWATAVEVERPDRPGAIRLLDVSPGRIFRFGSNNQQEADLVTRWLADWPGADPPGKAILVVDRTDPYSRDLAACFRRSIEAVAPGLPIEEWADDLSTAAAAGPPDAPGPTERRGAVAAWSAVREAPPGRSTWLVLPLQDNPTRRWLLALRDANQGVGDRHGGGLAVLCGDGIGAEELAGLGGSLPFPVVAASSESLPAPGGGPGPAQIPAEIAAALLDRLDRPPPATSVATGALLQYAVGRGDPAAFGRSLAFDSTGERLGDGLGHVLAVEPGRPGVVAASRAGDGSWSEPIDVTPPPSMTAAAPRP